MCFGLRFSRQNMEATMSRKAAGAKVQSPKVSSDERLTLDVPAAGRVLGLSRNAAYEAVRRGDIPAVKIGGRLLVPRAALMRLLETA
jgi:excisionase family DNA binding protein